MAEAPATVLTAPVVVKERDIQIVPTRWSLREFKNNDHTVTVEHGVELDDILRPQFWSHIAHNFKIYDEVVVLHDEGLWYMKLLVLSCGRTWAKMKLLSKIDLTSADVDLTQSAEFDAFEIKWRGPHCKFSLIQKADKSVIQEGFDRREDAIIALTAHVNKG
jgi:hypothetical protein